MNFYLDTISASGSRKPISWLPSAGFNKSTHTTELISIAMYAKNDDGADVYYRAINSEMDCKWLWNLHDLNMGNVMNKKIYLVRDHILKSLWERLEYEDYISDRNNIRENHYQRLNDIPEDGNRIKFHIHEMDRIKNIRQQFNLNRFSYLVKKYGRPKSEIAGRIKTMVYMESSIYDPHSIGNWIDVKHLFPVKFYSNHATHDWYLLCSLYGGVKNVPIGFPEYCISLKQLLDESVARLSNRNFRIHMAENKQLNFDTMLDLVKSSKNYPQASFINDPFENAKWNYKLHNYIKSINMNTSILPQG